MGCSCDCGARTIDPQKDKEEAASKSDLIEDKYLSKSVYSNYEFLNNVFNVEENIIICTIEKFNKNNFVTLNYNKHETVEKNTFKDKSLVISYNKGIKEESKNQDKFFILIDGDLEVFCLLDGHGPFGDKLAQNVQNFFFKEIGKWKTKHDYQYNNIEDLLKDLFSDCEASLKEVSVY